MVRDLAVTQSLQEKVSDLQLEQTEVRAYERTILACLKQKLAFHCSEQLNLKCSLGIAS